MVKVIFCHCDDRSELSGATLGFLSLSLAHMGLIPTNFTVLSEEYVLHQQISRPLQ
nr:MAG TPA: hypothetical protein [Bacteriophage sp.]